MNSHNVSIRVGMGGALGGTESKPSGENGGDTAFGDLIAYGGGGAGGVFYAGRDGASGGGGGSNRNHPGGQGIAGQGFGGGTGKFCLKKICVLAMTMSSSTGRYNSDSDRCSGGGGGAGGNGTCGDGGDGFESSISGYSTYYAG